MKREFLLLKKQSIGKLELLNVYSFCNLFGQQVNAFLSPHNLIVTNMIQIKQPGFTNE